MNTSLNEKRNGLLALTPIMVMILLLVGFAVYYQSVASIPLLIVFIGTAIAAIASTPKLSLSDKIAKFSEGAGSRNMLLMIWIFILAGSFASTARQMGAVDATVNLTLQILPVDFALAGLFFSACLVSLCMGTSVGTIVALMPIVVELASRTGIELPLITAAVVGGAFFGDNLSFISDTTIVSTQTQGCQLSDKFYANIRIALPVAIITGVIYLFIGKVDTEPIIGSIKWWKIIPYLAVLVLAACRMNVLIVLLLGNLLTCVVGIVDGSYDLQGWIQGVTAGIMGMSELILISMMAGGIFAIINHNGGLIYLTRLLTRRVQTKRGAEVSICFLVAIANLITANNTVAILSVGDISKYMSTRFNIDPRRSASLLDTSSCIVQGLIPYGAQLLMAGSIAAIPSVSIMPYLYYPILLAVAVGVAIVMDK